MIKRAQLMPHFAASKFDEWLTQPAEFIVVVRYQHVVVATTSTASPLLGRLRFCTESPHRLGYG
jgi:hypothetical protein